MKKIGKYVIWTLLTFCVLTGMIRPMTVDAEISGDFSYSVLDDRTAKLVDYDGTDSVLEIPSTIDGYEVSEIQDYTFYECKSLEKINIPKTVKKIDSLVFVECPALKEISVDKDNENYMSVDGVLFNKEQSVLHTFPAGKGGTYHVPESVSLIGMGAFRDAENLTEVWIPETVNEIEGTAFRKCENLQKVHLEEGLSVIQAYAFEYCTSLETIEIPDSVYAIYGGAFENCSSLKNFHISENVYLLGTYETDYNWGSGEPGWISEVDHSIFNGCENLESVTVDSNNEYFTSENGVLFNKDKTVLCTYPAASERTSYTVPNTVITVETGAFVDANHLKNIVLPENLQKIKHRAFEGCSNLESINIPESAVNWGDMVFEECTSLKEISIPKGIKCETFNDDTWEYEEIDGIPELTFTGCTSLEKVSIPDGIKHIGQNAFSYCTSLQEVIIPASVEFIGYECFEACTSLKKVILPELNGFGAGVFYGCENLILHIFEGSNVENYVDRLLDDGQYELLNPEIFTVSFDVNGGNGTVSDISVTKYLLYGELPVPNRSGYVFGGWYDEKEGGKVVDKNSTVRLNADQTLYAYWIKEADYIVSFNINGGSGKFADKTVSYGDVYGELPVPERENYKFAGWYTKAIGGVQITAEDIVSVNDDQTLYAQWNNEIEYIYFDSNGGTKIELAKMVFLSDTYGQMPIPKKYGYIFNGWYMASTGNEKITKDTLVDPNITVLYARWSPVSVEVKFDLNYSSYYGESKKVNYSHTYGVLPSPERPGYNFYGWYTAEEGGKQITASTKVDTIEKHTLYARWIKVEESIVTFEACGGKVSTICMKVTPNNKYGSLPTPTRTGYTFKGWYTSSSGGTKITQDSKVTIPKNHSIYAQWDANSYSVYFDANSGTVGTSSKNIKFDQNYGTLPVPTRSGYAFKGWYTSAEGGSCVTANSKMTTAKNHTLYAQWNKLTGTKPTWELLRYSFSNSKNGFGYSKGYKIPYSSYVLRYGDNSYAKSQYDNAGNWRGSCYGMVVTSAMFFQTGNSVSVTDFNYYADVPYDLGIKDYSDKFGINLRAFIECNQIGQASWPASRTDNLSALCQAVMDFQNTGHNPIEIGIFGYSGGHSVLGYKLESISKKESRLHIYDPNYPKEKRYITLYKNSSGDYTGWYYYLNDSEHWGSNYPGGMITYTTYEEYSWFDKEHRENQVFFSTNAENAAIYDSDGKEIVSIQEGKIISSEDEIYIVKPIGILAEGSEGETKPTELWMPKDLYTVKSLDSGEESLEVSISDMEQTASVTTTADEVILSVNDENEENYIKIPEENESYEITLSSSMDNTFNVVELKGETDDSEAVFSQIEGSLIADGMDIENNKEFLINDMEMTVIGNEAESEELITTIADYIPVEEICLNRSELKLAEGQSRQCKATLLPLIATNQEFVWESSDPDVVTVSDNGIIKAVGDGEAYVYASIDNVCAVCKIMVADEYQGSVARIAGSGRYETGYKVADEYKEILGVEKFDAVVVATGKNFADALAGSYLAVEKNAPIILTNGKADNIAALHTYIKENVEAGGKIYILGGEGAVPKSVESISGYDIRRLAGSSRYDTNLAILWEAGISGDSIIVATGKTFADSLSASATKLPILLVKPNGSLNSEQEAILSGMNNIYIVGGEGAVSRAYEEELSAYGNVTRVYGSSRYETSIAIANTFFDDVSEAVVASGKNFPDGLCGGPLAAAVEAPLILTADGKTTAAADYMKEKTIDFGYVLGGEGALLDKSVISVFGLESAAEIVKK